MFNVAQLMDNNVVDNAVWSHYGTAFSDFRNSHYKRCAFIYFGDVTSHILTLLLVLISASMKQ